MWFPRTDSDIQLAITEGSLSETKYLDAKRESGDTNSARAETAKDMASFALDGGSLIIGVEEDKKTGAFSLAPQPLAGLPEKLEQIAANRIDPPLFIRVTEIASASDPSRGYVLVEIPPSPTAPHMVDSRYFARGDRTTRKLTDAEVVRFHSQRHGQEERLGALLRDEIERELSLDLDDCCLLDNLNYVIHRESTPGQG
ncbi:helix-turn-helix domain-containing protein [Microbacterium sp. DT81.1]|uniref:AlbA family DNA-binding domain-containing protein n=1 Tax=Microbacterium sp. DT81.1 TaxID=3393413 RepID=UPI003CF999AF